MGGDHWLNLELDLQGIFGITVLSCLIGWDHTIPPPPTSPSIGLIYEGAIGQPRETTSPGGDHPLLNCHPPRTLDNTTKHTGAPHNLPPPTPRWNFMNKNGQHVIFW